VDDDIWRGITQAGREVEDGDCRIRTVDVAYSRRKLGLVQPTVIDGDVMTLLVQHGYNVRSNEVSAADDQNPHLTPDYKPSLTVSPAARWRNAPDVELTALLVISPNSSIRLPLPQRLPARP
jgi:hypothetical protein